MPPKDAQDFQEREHTSYSQARKRRITKTSPTTPRRKKKRKKKEKKEAKQTTRPQMQWPRLRALNPTLAEIRDEVATNAKQRFSMKPNPETSARADEDVAYWLIRANQGHSIAVASEGPAHAHHGGRGERPRRRHPRDVLRVLARHRRRRRAQEDGPHPRPLRHGDTLRRRRRRRRRRDGRRRQAQVVSGMRADAELLILRGCRESFTRCRRRRCYYCCR